jgi:filamentous hemagglutinin family protein
MNYRTDQLIFMKRTLRFLRPEPPAFVMKVLAFCLGCLSARSNPVGPTVTRGNATFTTQGSQFTIRTSDQASIKWQSFNIGLGQTTTFVQPSASSVVWNQINDSNPSQILGNLNANGYVILQNQAGFYVGGQASIQAHGLVMTTAPIAMPELSGGGAWQFNAPPPTASIINYGQINMANGGSAFLIAHNVENHGSISAPEGQIGLFAGKQVLVSERPDGRGLSAQVTLPEGSVDNSGKLIADGGAIALRAQVVNQGGLIQANSIREKNGVIELVANDSINLGGQSVIRANGDSQGVSAGGDVLIKSDRGFGDQAGSSISVLGGAQGGNGGQVEISASRMSAIHSLIDGTASPGFSSGKLFIDPDSIILSGDGDSAPSSGNVAAGDPPADTLTLNVNSFNDLISQNKLSQISLQAVHDIELQTIWTLPDSTVSGASLTLLAGRNITLDDGSGIQAGRNWSVNLFAGSELKSSADRQSGVDGIYLMGSSFIHSLNGNINLWAGNEVLIDSQTGDNVVGNGITTTGGGSISVTAKYGDVDTGANPFGYDFNFQRPYYTVSQDLGGISTAAGGDVSITAGGDVRSYLPLNGNPDAFFDGGSGAFGPQAGNVTIKAQGSIFGHYVVANGTGTMIAGYDPGDGTPTVDTHQNIGGPDTGLGTALSLVNGSWNLEAPKGSIYLQEVRNPNGVMNNRGGTTAPGFHLFDYDTAASVSLVAHDSVEITGLGAPRQQASLPILFPPTLNIEAGHGGVVLDTSVTLFPSPRGDLTITTTDGGSLVGTPGISGDYPTLALSDSGSQQWVSSLSFSTVDHAKTPIHLNDPNPVELSIAGNLATFNLFTTKPTQVTISGDMLNSSFVGENLHASDITSINVAGQIYNRSAYTFETLTKPIQTANLLNPGDTWDAIFHLAVDPALIAQITIPASATPDDIRQLTAGLSLFPDGNPGFVYNSATLKLGLNGPMSQAVRSALEGTLEVIRIGADGLPMVGADRHFVTTPVTFVDRTVIESLYQASQDVPKIPPTGYQIGGPGQFNIKAASMDLGNTLGILSWGIGGPLDDNQRYSSLAGVINSGAAINVDLQGDLTMFTSTIASLWGGDVHVTSEHGQMDLGSQELFNSGRFAFGIYTSGKSDVYVTADKDVNINGSRIAAYNGGNIFVKSLEGNVNAGSGGNVAVNVQFVSLDPNTGHVQTREGQIYGSGIVATSLPKNLMTPGGGTLPGDINVTTPHGDIVSSQAGILQLALDGSVNPGPTITLSAGTPASGDSPAYKGNIDLGNSGVIGGTVNLTAEGNIKGLVISRQDSHITAGQNFSGTLLSAGNANVSAGGTVSGTIIGVGGVSASAAKVDATLLSQNVSIGGGQSQSTLGTAATASTASQSAAQQASSETKEKATGDNKQEDDLKKKKLDRPLLAKRVGRVTVILPAAQ